MPTHSKMYSKTNPSPEERERRRLHRLWDQANNLLSKEEQDVEKEKRKEAKTIRIAENPNREADEKAAKAAADNAAYAAKVAAKAADMARFFESLIRERQERARKQEETLRLFRVFLESVISHSPPSFEEINKELSEMLMDRYQFLKYFIDAVEMCFKKAAGKGYFEYSHTVPNDRLYRALYPVQKQFPTKGNLETERIPDTTATCNPDDLVGIFYRIMDTNDTKTSVVERVSKITEVTKSILYFLSTINVPVSNISSVKEGLASTIVVKETNTIEFLNEDQIDVSEYDSPIVIQDWMGARLILWYILLKYEACTRTTQTTHTTHTI